MPSRARSLVVAVAMSLAASAVAAAAALSDAPASASAAATASDCAWANQIGAGGINGFGADLDAGYWITSFLATPGAGITLTGSYPQARYMSISAYNSLDPSLEPHLFDAEITPPATGVNPFQTNVDPGAAGTYSVQILAQPPPATPAPNTLYVGTNNALVYVMYRVYDAAGANPPDPTGGAGLPQEQTTFFGTPTATRQACVAPPSTAPVLPPGIGSLPIAESPEPAWTAATVSRLPDADTGYLTAQITQTPGQVVVFRAQMPTFPDTDAGSPPWAAPVDVRYWSICEYEQTALVAAGCVADHDALESPDGIATFVISTAQDQPSNATPANGVNWLPWGGAAAGLIVYRQMLAAFPQSIDAAAAAPALQTAMGPYYPQIAYCSVTEFESAGATGCLAPPTPPSPGGAPSSGPGSGSTATGASAHGRLSRAAIDRTLSPEIAPSGKAARITALLAARGYTFSKYKLPEAGRIELGWWYDYGKRHGKTLVASGSIALKKPLTGKLHMELTPGGRKLLSRSGRAGITGIASYTPAGAAKLTLNRAFTLER